MLLRMFDYIFPIVMKAHVSFNCFHKPSPAIFISRCRMFLPCCASAQPAYQLQNMSCLHKLGSTLGFSFPGQVWLGKLVLGLLQKLKFDAYLKIERCSQRVNQEVKSVAGLSQHSQGTGETSLSMVHRSLPWQWGDRLPLGLLCLLSP